MHMRKACTAGLLVVLLWTLTLHAQFPSIPGVPSAPGTPSMPGVPGTTISGTPAYPAGYAPPSNIWSKLCPTAGQLAACKAKFCASGFGRLFSSMLMPVSMFSGGLFGSCCPTSPWGFGGLQPGTLDGPAGAIAADEAGAKARRANMRYLGTVDCHYWPEAEAGLIVGLRTDKNECVRWEAAMSLAKGCCCTKKTIEALRLVVTSSERDGNPSETSERVKAAAMAGLNHCLCCYREKAPEIPREKPTASANPTVNQILPAYYVKLDNEPAGPILAEARELVAKAQSGKLSPKIVPTGSRSVSTIMARANDPKSFPEPVAPAAATAAANSAQPGALKPKASEATAPSANRDLYHWLKTQWELRNSSAGVGESYIVTVDSVTAATTEAPPQVLTEAPPPVIMEQTPVQPVPATGRRDLINILRGAVSGQ